MTVRRIVANIPASDTSQGVAFYRDFLGLDLLMNHEWIKTFGSQSVMPVQVSIASQGGSATPVPRLSIEVDDLSEALDKAARLGVPIEYGPVSEPWGVRRFFVRDPFGTLVNILQHE